MYYKFVNRGSVHSFVFALFQGVGRSGLNCFEQSFCEIFRNDAVAHFIGAMECDRFRIKFGENIPDELQPGIQAISSIIPSLKVGEFESSHNILR